MVPRAHSTAFAEARRFFGQVIDDRMAWSALTLLLVGDAIVMASRAVRKWGLMEPTGLVAALAETGSWLTMIKVVGILGIMGLGWWQTRSRAYAALTAACSVGAAEVVAKLHLDVAPDLGRLLLPFDSHWTIDVAVGKAAYFLIVASLVGGVVRVAWQRSVAWERGLILLQTAVFAVAGFGAVSADLVRTLQKGVIPSFGSILAVGRLELVVELLATSVALAMSLGIVRAAAGAYLTTPRRRLTDPP